MVVYPPLSIEQVEENIIKRGESVCVKIYVDIQISYWRISIPENIY